VDGEEVVDGITVVVSQVVLETVAAIPKPMILQRSPLPMPQLQMVPKVIASLKDGEEVGIVEDVAAVVVEVVYSLVVATMLTTVLQKLVNHPKLMSSLQTFHFLSTMMV